MSKKAKATRAAKPSLEDMINKRLREGALIGLTAIAFFVLVALATYHPSDPGWSHSQLGHQIHNAAGKTGALFADVLFSLFGVVSFLIPVSIGFGGIIVYQGQRLSFSAIQAQKRFWGLRLAGLSVALVGACGLIHLHGLHWYQPLPMAQGGIIGLATQALLVNYFNFVGATVILAACFLAGFTFFTGLSWVHVSELTGRATWQLMKRAGSALRVAAKRWLQQLRLHPRFFKLDTGNLPIPVSDTPSKKDMTKKSIKSLIHKRKVSSVAVYPADGGEINFQETPDDEMPAKFDIKSVAKLKKQKRGAAKRNKIDDTNLSLTLLEAVEEARLQGFSDEQLAELSQLVEQKLAEFGVQVEVVSVHPGPVVTRFEMALAPGLKVSKISGLAKDLARSLSVISVRVVEVIPGKSTVGLEIPNENREIVRLKEILESGGYQGAHSPLTLGLGKDISGEPVSVNLAKMPHLLVAGTTGSGKSVGINAMLLSVLYKSGPDDVRMILIDPKMLELAVYDDIPHLLTPVVTDMKDAANALRWCVGEMERRYQLMAALGVRNINGYNEKILSAQAAGEPVLDPLANPEFVEPEPLEKLPYIVVVVDEFADLIMVVGKKVEELIARIAQKARAAGIHLILATQRPSVDVITGLIKANIPTRIGFQVSSRIDSRTILDQHGAEQLLGHGDMLYLPPGSGVPIRVHGAFVADDEVHKVTDHLRSLGRPDYIEAITSSSGGGGSFEMGGSDEEQDDLYDEAVQIVTDSRKASISYLQRRLKIGYNRAARLIESMEEQGVVGPMQSNGQREVIAGPAP